jgi:hypothetical protein
MHQHEFCIKEVDKTTTLILVKATKQTTPQREHNTKIIAKTKQALPLNFNATQVRVN